MDRSSLLKVGGAVLATTLGSGTLSWVANSEAATIIIPAGDVAMGAGGGMEPEAADNDQRYHPCRGG